MMSVFYSLCITGIVVWGRLFIDFLRKKGKSMRSVSTQTDLQLATSSTATVTSLGKMEIYIPATGEKYHVNKNCSGMKEPKSYKPCAKCFR